jgi:hypothetical protein
MQQRAAMSLVPATPFESLLAQKDISRLAPLDLCTRRMVGAARDVFNLFLK